MISEKQRQLLQLFGFIQNQTHQVWILQIMMNEFARKFLKVALIKKINLREAIARRKEFHKMVTTPPPY